MEISKTNLPLIPKDTQIPINKEEKTPPLPQEKFSKTEASESGLIGKMSRVMNAKLLDKRGKDFCIRSHVTSRNGITYISYQSTKPSKEKGAPANTGYISAVSPQGEILWESPVREEGLSKLKIGPDGTIFAITRDHLRALNTEGLLKFEHKFEEAVHNHWIDSEGNHYFIKDTSRELYKVDKNGNRVDLPADFIGIKGCEVVQSDPDTLFVREGNTFRELDLKEGVKKNEFVYNDPVESKPNSSLTIDHFEVDKKGDIRIWIRNNTFIPSPPPFDEHMGLGFGRFSRFHRWGMPHIPRDDQYYGTQTICVMSMEKLGKDGKIVWKAENLGQSPREVQLLDGTVIYSNNNAEMMENPNYDPNAGSMNYKPKIVGTGKYFIGRIGPGGKKNEEFLKVEGQIQAIMASPREGNFLICHGRNIVSEFNRKGELVRSQAVPAEEKDLYVDGSAGENIIIFKNSMGTRAFGLHLDSGKFTPFTDNEVDYSYKVVSKEMELEEEAARKKDEQGIEVSDEWVNVGGVVLWKNTDRKSDKP